MVDLQKGPLDYLPVAPAVGRQSHAIFDAQYFWRFANITGTFVTGPFRRRLQLLEKLLGCVDEGRIVDDLTGRRYRLHD